MTSWLALYAAGCVVVIVGFPVLLFGARRDSAPVTLAALAIIAAGLLLVLRALMVAIAHGTVDW